MEFYKNRSECETFAEDHNYPDLFGLISFFSVPQRSHRYRYLMTLEENWEDEDTFFHLWLPSLHKKFMTIFLGKDKIGLFLDSFFFL
jgi:hypothetical protein